jgi:hypothetical protein
MELEQLLFAGSLGGLISILSHSVLWSVVGFVRKPAAGAFDPQVQVSEAFLHMLCGIGLGLLFWLSWGLAAIVNVSWWVRGLAFGGLTALLLVPAVVNFGAEARIDAKRFAIFGSRWLTTCLIAGLICARSWERL